MNMFYNILCKCYILSVIFKYVSAVPGIVETVAGGGRSHKGKVDQCNDINNSRDGVGDEARLNYPWGIAYDHVQNAVYVADCGCIDTEHSTDKIRKIDLKTQEVRTIAGSTQGFADGFGPYAHFKHIAGITIDTELEMLYIADSGNHRIRMITLANNKVTTIAGLPRAGFVDQGSISSQFNNPQDVAIQRTSSGKRNLYIADTDNHAIRIIHLEIDDTGDVRTFAGGLKGFKDGVKLQAQFYHPVSLVIDSTGKFMYVGDNHNHAIRRLELANGMVTTLTEEGYAVKLAYDEGPKHLLFHFPEGLAYDSEYHILYVCEFNNNDILAVVKNGAVKTLAGRLKGKKNGVGVAARFNHPSRLTYDPKSRMLYLSDQYNHLVRSVSAFGSNKIYNPAIMKKKKRKKKAGNNPYMNMYVYAAVAAIVMIFLFLIRPCFRLCFKVNGQLPQTAIRTTTL